MHPGPGDQCDLPSGCRQEGQSIRWWHCGPAAAAGWVAHSSFPLQRSLLYCNHTIIMPLKCHICRNPHKQGISSCQKIVVLLLMTRFPPAAPLHGVFCIFFPFLLVSEPWFKRQMMDYIFTLRGFQSLMYSCSEKLCPCLLQGFAVCPLSMRWQVAFRGAFSRWF